MSSLTTRYALSLGVRMGDDWYKVFALGTEYYAWGSSSQLLKSTVKVRHGHHFDSL